MILNSQGRPAATDGPTGRQFHCIEMMKDNKTSWAITVPGGSVAISADEMIAVMGLLIHTVAVRQLAHQLQHKTADVLMKNAGKE